MTKFRKSLRSVVKITSQEDANQYFKEYVEFLQKELDKNPRTDGMTAEEIARNNIGHYAGYYDYETRLRMEQLFGAVHPIYGPAIRLCDKQGSKRR